MTLTSDYLQITATIAARLALPPIRHAWFPSPASPAATVNRFGLIELADGTTGLVHLGGDELRAEIAASGWAERLAGQPPEQVAAGFAAADPATRAIALGAMNAIGQLVVKRSGVELDFISDALEPFTPSPQDRFGMVGFFPPLVRRLRDAGVPLVVIELKEELVRRLPGLEVTLDASRLRDCNKILSTSTVLLNDTGDAILAHCGAAERVALVGPSAGFVPDALFSRGVDTIGAAQVVDPAGLLARCRAGEKWGEATRKYCLRAETYPGLAALLERAAGHDGGEPG